MTPEEEREAITAMRAASSKEDLAAVWWSLCDHSEGEQRQRLQDVYADLVVQFAPLARAG